MSLEDAFRAVLAARLPTGHAWAAWIDGTVAELAAAGVALTPEEVPVAVNALHYERLGLRTDTDAYAANFALAARLEAAS